MINPFDQFDGANSSASNPFDQFDAPTANKKQNKGITGDLATDLKRGVEQLPGIATGLADIPVAAITGKPLVGQAADTLGGITGFAPSKWAKDAEAEYSPGRVAAKSNVNQAWEDNKTPFSDAAGGDFAGIGNIAKSYIQNPQQLVGSVAESLPSMIGGAKVGQAVTKAAGILSPTIAAAGGEGAMMAGQQMDQLSQTDADPRAAAAASALTGIAGGAIGALGGKVASKLGVVDPDIALAGGATRAMAGEPVDQTIKGAAKEGAKRMAGGAISEGLFEELPQSVVEQGLSNFAQNKPIDEGMGRAAIEGTLAGSLMGGAFNALPGSKYVESKRQPAEDTPEIAGLLPVPTYTGTPSDQMLQADAERQNSVDAAQKSSDQLYAERAAYEEEIAKLYPSGLPTLTTELAPLQQRIDEMLGIDVSSIKGLRKLQYQKQLEAAFKEVIGITHDANGREIPLTMGALLDSQAMAEEAAMRRVATENANLRAQDLADQESRQQQDIAPGYVAPEIPVVGTLSAMANMAVQSGAHKNAAMQQAAQIQLEERKPIAASTEQIAEKAPQANDAQDGIADIAAQAASQGQNGGTGQAIDLTDRNVMQLNYLARNGKPGHKEAAIAEIQRRGVQVSMAPQAKTDAIAPAGKVNSDKPATNSSPVPALNAGNSVNLPATSISSLQDKLDKTEPFSEQSQLLTERLQLAVTDDAKSAIGAGEMPVYKVTDHVSVAIHPSAQKEGMIQVTRYTKDGVIGDSQYNSIDEAVRFEGLTHKPRIPSNEAIAHIENSIAAEAEYQKRKNEQQAGAGLPAPTDGDSRPAPVANQTDAERYAAIKETPPLQRTQADVAWANEYKASINKPAVEAAAKADKAKADDVADTDGYADSFGKNSALKQKIRNALNMPTKNNGAIVRRKDLIRSRIADGATIQTREGQRAIVSKDGAYILESALTKTAIDYAEYLAGRKNQVPVKNAAPAAATVPAETVAPKQEPIKNEDDWLGALFGAAPTAAESASKEVQTNRQAQDKADRVDSAIAMLTGEIEASNAAAAEVAARNYKSNRKQIELKGDGPGKNGSLSISAINESRKRRTVEALQNASSSIKQAIEFIAENPDAAFKQVADMEAAVTKQFNEGFFGPSAKLDGQLDMAVGSLIGSGSYSGEGSAGRKLRMAAHAYAAVDAVSHPKTDAAPEARQDKAPVSTLQPDPALQNRDRGRAASVNQMQSIARNPDYMRLGPSRTPDSGAPMVFAVGNDTQKIPPASFGANDTAVMSDGQRVPFRYAVVDARSVEPSNFADGATNPAFSSDTPGTIKALNNGRTAGVRAAHEGNTAANYTAELLADQAHGVSPAAIRNTPNPMLVRVYAEQANTGDMAAKSQGQGLGMSASERATQDAELMTSDVLDKFAPGDIASAGNRDFVRAFVGKLAENELADMMDATGNLSQDGRRRIEAALLTAAYGKSDLVQELFESTDTDIKAIGNALKVMSGQWAAMRQAAKEGSIDPATDMTANLIEAVNIVRRSRAEGSSIAELAGQGDLMGGNYLNELSELFLRIFYKGKNYDRARGGDKVIAALQEVVTSAMNTKAEAGLFGDSFKATPKQIVESARSKIDEENKPASQSSLFGANGQATAVSQGNRSESAQKPGEVGSRPVSPGRGEETGKQAEPVIPAAEKSTAELIAAAKINLRDAKTDEQKAAHEKEIRRLRQIAMQEPIQEDEKAPEQPRRKYLSREEIEALAEKHGNHYAAGYSAQVKGYSIQPPSNLRSEKNKNEYRDGWIAAADSEAKAAEQSPAVDAKKQEEAKPVAEKAADEKPADSKATADAGEELTYNKRNRRTGGLKWDDIKDKNAALRVKEVVKAKVYPKPDYQALVDGGMRDVVAHIVKQAYDAISPAPKMKRGAEVSDAALQSYIAGVNRVMDGVMKWANDGTAVAKWANAQSKLSGGSFSISELATAESLLDTVYPGGWKASREEIIMIGGNKMLSALQPGHDEVGRAMKDIKLGWPAKSESWQKQGYKVVNAETVDVELYSSPQRDKRAAYVSGTVTAGNQRIDSFIVRGTADKESQEVQDAIAEKRKQLEGNYVLVDKVGRIEGVYADEEAAIEAAREKVKRESGEIKEVGRKVSEVGREGVEHRLPGDDVTTERLKETFGFRGVNFGNWMKGETNAKTAERQLHLNHLFDAFMDLAQLLNVPPKAMSLNGMLGIAVGAQGSGKAWAHFVPGVNEINVTRTNGAGALAHEWGHALDHYFATMGGMDRNNEPYLSAHVGTLTNRVENGRYVRTPVELVNVRPEVAAQFQSIVEAMTRRKETDAEYADRIRRDKDIAGQMVADEIKKITEDIGQAKGGWGTPSFIAEIRGLAERIAALNYGDGRVSIGSSEVPAVVAEIAEAYKAASGVPLKNAETLGYYADHYRVMSAILESEEGRTPREVNTDYKKASDAADSKKKPYWSTKLEMFARAFDAYVVDSLAEKAASNTYLAGIEAVAPQGDERKTIGKAFDFLFAELKTKETEQGVMLYNQASAGKISPADKAIYGMAAEGKSAAEVLKFIASASRSPFNRQVAKLLLKTGIAPSVTVGDSKTWKISDAKSGETFAAAYDPKTDTVALFRPASAERNMLHELVHAASLKALAKKGMASAQMKALFAHVEKTGKLTGMYGIRNVDEFIAEVFSNPKFQAMLKQVSAAPVGGKPSSAWDWFIRVVRGILGLKQGQDNALSQALDIGIGVMRENMALQSGDGVIRFNHALRSTPEGNRPLNATRLAELRRIAAGLERPKDAVFLRVTDDGKAITTGPKGVRIPETFIRFAESNGLDFEARRNGEGRKSDGHTVGDHITSKTEPMPAEYRESGALYFGEGNEFFDRTGKTRYNAAPGKINQTDTEAFKKWFGDSKVVDADGNPMRVYHGTGATDINDFKVSERGTYGGGIYLTPELRGANDYAIYRGAPSSTVYPVYAAIKNPASGAEAAQVASWKGEENAREELIRRGYDGVVDMRSGEIVAFYPSQVKSAIGNNGDFDGSNLDIRYNVADEGWSITEPSKMDDVIYALQDKQIDMKRVVQSIMQTGKKIKDDLNAYLQEELFHGRAAKGVKDFLDFELRPLLVQMNAANVDMGDFEEYLWNRHAPERNAQIAKINPDMPDAGSGIKTADARTYLAGLSAEKKKLFESLAAKVEAINKNSQKVLVESGLEKQSTIDAWNGAYQHYVPLQREDVDSGNVGTGKGFSVRGSSTKRAMGSGKKVVDIIANLTMQRERNIVRAEKNRVSNAVMGLAIENPSADFWTVDKAPKERVVEETAIYTVRDEAGKKLEEFTRMDEADRFARNNPGSDIEQTWGDRVKERVTPGFTSRDNVLLTRINGEDHYVIFNERDERAMRMAMALKNLDADNMGRVLSVVGKATRYLAAVNTQYNPVFGVINLIRDAQGALLNLSSTPLAGDQKRVLGYTKDALIGIYKDIRAHRAGKVPSSKWAALFEEFQKEGGQTGYRDQYANAEARAESIVSELAQFKEGKAKQLTRGVIGWLSDYNETMENAVRLAAYKAAKEKGMSNQQSASLAKNITVNFNRKGQMATQVGALYAFFNASVQGTARIAETLFDMKDGDIKTAKLSKTGKKIVYGGIMLGSMQALLLAASGFDDDEPPEFIRERNLIIPDFAFGSGKYLTLAMPLGFHVIPGIGRIATEFVLSGGKDPLKKLAAFGSMFADSFNPIGSAGFSLQTITPSVVDPFAALAENRDFTGKEIYREDFNKLNPTPGMDRAKDTASAWSKAIAYGLNFMTGGTDYKPGAFSPSPDSIDYLIGQATGGVGRELSKTSQTVGAAFTGEELPLHKVPLVGRFVGDTTGQAGESAKFYDAIKQINMHEAEYNGLIGDGRREEAKTYLEENPAVRLMMAGNHYELAVRKLRDQKRRLIDSEAGQDKVRGIDEKITATMRQFNERAGAVL